MGYQSIVAREVGLETPTLYLISDLLGTSICLGLTVLLNTKDG
jgi:hypothetical protein